MSPPVLPATRILKGSLDATLSWTPLDADGEPLSVAGNVTVAVTRSDGAAVVVGSVSGSGSEPRTVTVGVAELGYLDWLSAVWSVDGDVVFEQTVEIVGGTIGSLAELELSQPTLKNESKPAKLQARREVEDMFTNALRRSPFPRFYRERVSGADMRGLIVTWPNVHRVNWVRTYTDTIASTPFTGPEIAAVVEDPVGSGVLVRTDGAVWPWGRANIEIGYEHGYLEPPADLRRVMHHAVRAQVTGNKTGISDRAMSYTPPEGGNVVLATPGLSIWVTGIPGIDEAIKRYRFDEAGVL